LDINLANHNLNSYRPNEGLSATTLFHIIGGHMQLSKGHPLKAQEWNHSFYFLKDYMRFKSTPGKPDLAEVRAFSQEHVKSRGKARIFQKGKCYCTSCFYISHLKLMLSKAHAF
jgi:hypothetical protein